MARPHIKYTKRRFDGVGFLLDDEKYFFAVLPAICLAASRC
jgi:hypothetical protein